MPHFKEVTLVSLKRLVVTAFLFAFLPVMATWFFDLDPIYESIGLAARLSFPLLKVIVLTSLQLIILANAFLSWYLGGYSIG